MNDKIAYEMHEMPWSRSTTYRLADEGQLKLIKVRDKTLVDGPSARSLIASRPALTLKRKKSPIRAA